MRGRTSTLGLIQGAAPKGIDRSIEKVSRSYANDVSKVVDIARQAIIFKSFHDLTACLDCILADASISVLRIKNRFDGDTLCVAGYRDVNVNMVIVSEAARGLGLRGMYARCSWSSATFGIARVRMDTAVMWNSVIDSRSEWRVGGWGGGGGFLGILGHFSQSRSSR